jgi:hypothetical protein
MSHSAFQKGNKVKTVEVMIDYVIFMQNIAVHEAIPGAVDALGQTIDELRKEKERRINAQEANMRQSA